MPIAIGRYFCFTPVPHGDRKRERLCFVNIDEASLAWGRLLRYQPMPGQVYRPGLCERFADGIPSFVQVGRGRRHHDALRNYRRADRNKRRQCCCVRRTR